MSKYYLLSIFTASLAFGQGSQPGMGSIPYSGGVTFRVWAPNANAVSVEGDFNNWSQAANPLEAEGNGDWSVDVPGAVVGQQYSYVMTSPGFPTQIRRDPYCRLVTGSNYPPISPTGYSIVYDVNAYQWQTPPFTAPPARRLMIYEMQIATYNGSAGVQGTFQSAIARLGEIVNLGYNAVEIMPVNENNLPSSIGYEPSDQFAVANHTYGGPDNFKALVDTCHAAGIAVILDIVHNHWGPWSLTTDQFDGWYTTEYPDGIYFYDEADYSSPWGPRPNYSSTNVAQYIYDSLTMWQQEYRIDGFRWDSVSCIYNTCGTAGVALPDGLSLLQNANAQTVNQNAAFVNIAEDLSGNAATTEPAAQGGAGFLSQWNGNFVSNMRAQLTQSSDSSVNMNAIASAIRPAFNQSYIQSLNYTESHNEVSGGQRLTTLIDPSDPTGWLSLKKSTLGAAILFTSPGIPMIYQGQEFVENEPLEVKLPLQWGLAKQFAGIRKLWANLAAARADTAGHTPNLTGDSVNIYQVDNTNKFIAYERYDSQAAGVSIVVANFTGSTRTGVRVGLPASGTWVTHFNSDSKMFSSTFSGSGSKSVKASGGPFAGLPYSASLTIGPYSLMILSQQ
jgi:1,4-alpha-glucan branching enzyme